MASLAVDSRWSTVSEKPPALHAVNCRIADCEWGAIRSSMIGLYGDLEDHLKDEHGYTEAEWRDTRRRLEQTGDSQQTTLSDQTDE